MKNMTVPKRARIEEMREVSLKFVLFEESCVIPQGILKAAASQMSCFLYWKFKTQVSLIQCKPVMKVNNLFKKNFI